MTSWKDKSIMYWYDASILVPAYIKVTDHNRSELSVEVERFENAQRMVDATMRRQVIAKKRTWSCSWDMLPSANDHSGGMGTVDSGMSGEQIEAFHNTHNGAFDMKITEGDGTQETVLVMITDFNKAIVKRGVVDFWNVSITLTEV